MLPLRNQTLILRIRYKLECPRHILPFDRSTNDGRIRKTNNSHSLLFFSGNEYFQITFSSSFFFFPFFINIFHVVIKSNSFFSKKKKKITPLLSFSLLYKAIHRASFSEEKNRSYICMA